ncbi:MAG: BrnA antitoxin family protein [Nitrospinae bacterium]|nr:BrnA antitoxin family protein [Nitrospinota bacterium]
MKKEVDFGKGKRGPIASTKGKTRITICIDTDVLNWFRAKSEREGRAYQPYINEALREYTRKDQRAIQDIVRDTIRAELKLLRKAV